MEDDSDILSCWSEDESQAYHLPNLEHIEIHIEIQGIYSSGLNKFTKYLVYGQDFKGTFQISRRFKEFRRLHEVLSLNWLGCIVPVLPKKKSFGNLKHQFVERRKGALDIFLQNISKIDYLYLDEYFQQFIRCETYFLTICKDFISPSFEAIAKKYQKAFKEEFDSDDDAEIDIKVKEVENTCLDNVKTLKMFRQNTKSSQKISNQFYLSHKRTYESIGKLSKILSIQENEQNFEVNLMVDPLIEVKLKSWIVIKEVKGLIICIGKYFKLRKSITSFQVQIDNYDSLILELNSGKKSIINMKSIDETLADVVKVQSDILLNMKSLKVITKKLSYQIFKTMTSFQDRHYSILSFSIKNFADLSIKNYENLAADAMGLEVKLNL